METGFDMRFLVIRQETSSEDGQAYTAEGYSFQGGRSTTRQLTSKQPMLKWQRVGSLIKWIAAALHGK
jgi:hypothetical protein